MASDQPTYTVCNMVGSDHDPDQPTHTGFAMASDQPTHTVCNTVGSDHDPDLPTHTGCNMASNDHDTDPLQTLSMRRTLLTSSPKQKVAPTAFMQAPAPRSDHAGSVVSDTASADDLAGVKGTKREATYSPLPAGGSSATSEHDSSISSSAYSRSKRLKVEEPTNGLESQGTSLFVGQDEPGPLDVAACVKPRQDSLFVPAASQPVPTTPLSVKLQQLVTGLPATSTASAPDAGSGISTSTKKNRVAPYDEQLEKMSSGLAVDKPSFKAAERMLSEVAYFVLDNVEQLSAHYSDPKDLEIKALCQRLQDDSSPDKYLEHTLSVPVYGVAGSGKSTLMNNLLNRAGAAPTDGGDQSCTHVKHEYVYTEHQGAYVKATVCFLSTVMIQRLVEGCMDKVIEHERFDQADCDEEDLVKLKEEKEDSLHFLSSLIVARDADPGFSSRAEMEAYMLDGLSTKKEELEIRKHLLDCVNAFLCKHGAGGGKSRHEVEADGLDKLKVSLRPFAGPVAGQDRSPWTLVEKISISLPALILEHCVNLIDVPGVMDTNHTRVRIADETFAASKTILVTHQYKRASDDRALEDILVKCICAAKRVILVITHTDDLGNMSLFTRDEETDENLAELREVEQELLRKIAEVEDDDADDDYDMLLAKLRAEHKQVSDDIFKLRIKLRNASARIKMQAKYRELELKYTGYESSGLTVICVCGTEYFLHMMGYRLKGSDHRPRLSVGETGVVALRTAIRGVPSDGKLGVLERAANHKGMARILIAFQLWCNRTKLERKKEVERYVTEPRKECAVRCSAGIKDLRSDVKKIMMTLEHEHFIDWKTEAEATLRGWAKYHNRTYQAFCRRFGEHKKDGQDINWNGVILDILEGDLRNAFKEAFDTIDNRETKLLTDVVHLMNGIVQSLQASPELLGQSADMEPFYKDVEYCRINAESVVEESFAELKEHMRGIRNAALFVADPDTSFLAIYMQDTYQSCAEKSGKGSHDARKTAMRNKLTGPESIFRDVIDCSTAAFEKFAKSWATTTTERICQVFEEVEHKFDRGYLYEDEPETSQRREFRKALREVIKEARVAVEGPLAEEIRKCKE